MWWCSWLKLCITSQKVAGLITDGVIGSFHLLNPGCILTLGLTQPPTEMSIRDVYMAVKAAHAQS
jgi:hypothetical protein